MFSGILSAWITAPLYCVVVTPMEVLKVKLQIQRESNTNAKYKGKKYLFYLTNKS